MHTIDDLKNAIMGEIEEGEIYILDPRNDGIHLEALVISPRFEGLPLFKQHQLVMKGLRAYFDTSLHAMGVKTFTPEKWNRDKENHL